MLQFVYVVPRRSLFPTHYPHGLVAFAPGNEGSETSADGDRPFTRSSFGATVSEHGYFHQRDLAEHDPDLKQVIPYTLIVGRDADHGTRVLCLRRTKAGGDARLHDKLSIGVGGHVEPEDATVAERDGTDPIVAGSRRELDEELYLPPGIAPPRPVGLINDDTNPVGAVHVGLVQVLVVDDPARIAVREKDVLVGELRTPAELRAMHDGTHPEFPNGANFETWSALLLDQLDELIAELADEPARGLDSESTATDPTTVVPTAAPGSNAARPAPSAR